MSSLSVESRPLAAGLRFLVVGGAHVAIGVLIAQGLGLRIPVPAVVESITTRVFPAERTDPPPRLLPSGVPEFQQRIAVSEPILKIDATIAEPILDTTALTPELARDEAGSSVPRPAPVVLKARADPNHPVTQPAYPAGAIRRSEQGAVIVSVWVLPSGRVGDTRVDTGSGFELLDHAALIEARTWRLLPATRDGVAIPQWYTVRVVFNLLDR